MVVVSVSRNPPLTHTDIGRMTLAPGLGNYTALGLELIISDVSDL